MTTVVTNAMAASSRPPQSQLPKQKLQKSTLPKPELPKPELPRSMTDAVEQLIVAGDKSLATKKLTAAELYYKSAETKYRALKKTDGQQLADILTGLSRAYRRQKKFDLAIQTTKALMTVEQKLFGSRNIFIAEDLKTLGDTQHEANLNQDAAASLREAIALSLPAESRMYNSCIINKDLNDSRKTELVIDCYKALTDCLGSEGDTDGAVEAYKQALALPAIEDMDVYWVKYELSKDYIKFLERNDLDTTSAKDLWHTIERLHEANHEYRPGELPKS